MNPFTIAKDIKNIEKKIGRVKSFRYGPRKIDIDIISPSIGKNISSSLPK